METDKDTLSLTRKRISAGSVDPFQRQLLENKGMTTSLLQQLTGTVIAATAVNRVHEATVQRFSLLTGAGAVFVYADCRVNLSLLPGAAAAAVLQGEVPLGRIIAECIPENTRSCYSFFSVRDEELAAVMYGRLGDRPPTLRKAGDLHYSSAPLTGKRFIRSVLSSSFFSPGSPGASRVFPGRTYVILLNNALVAHIEEVFSPQIREKAHERRDSRDAAFPSGDGDVLLEKADHPDFRSGRALMRPDPRI